MYCCKLCNRSNESLFNFSKHITNKHKIKSKEYYDSFLKKEGEDICKFCNGLTRFNSLSAGYNESCIKCRSSATKEFRQRLKEDTDKFNKFRNKVAENQSKIWEEREKTGEAQSIRTKIGSTHQENNSLLTPDDRKIRFGWLNHLSIEDKEEWKQTVMRQTGMYRWWNEASNDDKQKVINKRLGTMLKTEELLITQSKLDSKNYKKYREAVDFITARTYAIHKDLIDPTDLRSNHWHLDHKFSVRAGFLHNVDPKIIGGLQNLEIISGKQNVTKNAKCSITLEQLLENINV
jgi:hypothetical protein